MVRLLVKIIVVVVLLLVGAVGIIQWGSSIAQEECDYLPENLDISMTDDGKDFVRTCTYKGVVVHEERLMPAPYETKPWDTARLVAALQQDGYTASPGEPGELILSRRVRHGLFTVEYRATVELTGDLAIDQRALPRFLGIPLTEYVLQLRQSSAILDWFPENNAEHSENVDASGL